MQFVGPETDVTVSHEQRMVQQADGSTMMIPVTTWKNKVSGKPLVDSVGVPFATLTPDAPPSNPTTAGAKGGGGKGKSSVVGEFPVHGTPEAAPEPVDPSAPKPVAPRVPVTGVAAALGGPAVKKPNVSPMGVRTGPTITGPIVGGKNPLVPGAAKAVNDTKADLNASLDRQATMDDIAQAAMNGDQQAQFAILANHIAMTLQQPKVSARPTKAMYEEAAASLPWMQKITKTFDSDGLLSGLTLSPDQVQKMVNLAHAKTKVMQEHLGRVQKDYNDTIHPGSTPAAALPVTYKLTATGKNGHKIGSNDNGNTWFDVTTGKAIQ